MQLNAQNVFKAAAHVLLPMFVEAVQMGSIFSMLMELLITLVQDVHHPAYNANSALITAQYAWSAGR